VDAAEQSRPVADQAALAEQLLSENREERHRAFWRVWQIEPGATEPILRDALVTLQGILKN
jgi:hypothetical protein